MSDELTYGEKLIAEAIEDHFGERQNSYDEDVDDNAPHAAWEAFDALIATRIRSAITVEGVVEGEAEPVAQWQIVVDGEWVNEDADMMDVRIMQGFKIRPLYAAPRKASGLSDAVRMFWFLSILKAVGGSTSANDEPHEWIGAFCSEHEGRDPDTFNIAADAGYTHVTHDTFLDSSTAYLTDKGRAHLAALEAASLPIKGGEALPADVVRLVIAGREIMDMCVIGDEAIELDQALEAFSERVPYENEPEEPR